MMIGSAVATQFGVVMNWPLGSALIVSTVLVFAALIALLFMIRRAFKIVEKARRQEIS
jgi:ABC-type spermidine/putrescine transport system permease subunit I